MELVEMVQDLIANLGFPIACVCVMFFQNEKEREQRGRESEKWIEAINHNTAVIEKLLERL